MPTQNNGTELLSPSKDVITQSYYNNNFSEQFHSTFPPTYEQSANPEYLPSSPSLDDLLQGDLNYNNNTVANKNDDNKIEPSSSPITNSLLNSPIPSAPPVELIVDDESPSLVPPPSVANPNFRSNTFNTIPNLNPSPYNMQQQHVTIKQTEPPTGSNFDCTIKTICNFLSPLKEKRNWIALIYLLFWNFGFGMFNFIWIISTFCVSITMMIIPPIGCILLTWSVYSWRALARIELSTFDLVCSSDLSQQKVSSPSPVYIQRKPDQGCFDYLIQILMDSFTVRCFAYFVFIKPWVSVLATSCCLITFIIGVNFLLLSIFMPMYRDIVNFESKLGKRVLSLKNNDVSNENANDERMEV